MKIQFNLQIKYNPPHNNLAQMSINRYFRSKIPTIIILGKGRSVFEMFFYHKIGIVTHVSTSINKINEPQRKSQYVKLSGVQTHSNPVANKSGEVWGRKEVFRIFVVKCSGSFGEPSNTP